MSAVLDLFTRVPPEGSQCYRLLVAFQNGARLTVAEALEQHQVWALSQRAGELRSKYGWPIQSEWYETSGGARVKRYFL